MQIKKLFTSQFIKDNFHLFLGSFILGAFGFFFHFYMGRMLGPEDYGALGVLLALVLFMTIPLQALQLSISKFVASYQAKKDDSKLGYLFHAGLKKLNLVFAGLFVISFPVNYFILSPFLHVDFLYLMLTSLLLLIVPTLSLCRGFLQGLQLFQGFSWSLSIEGLAKFLAGVAFVLFGFRVGGGIFAVFCSFLLAGLYSYYHTKPYIRDAGKKFDTKDIYLYAQPVLFTLILFVSFYSLDLLLVKHFFTSTEAGYYTAINLLGKIVLFVTFSIVDVMFPKVVTLSETGKPHKKILFQSFLVMLVVLAPILLVYFLFDDLIIHLLFGAAYSSAGIAYLLLPYGLFMGFVVLSRLFCMYLLSLKRYTFLALLFIINLLEIGLIYAFHESLEQVVYVLMALGGVLFVLTGLLSFISGKTINRVFSSPPT